MLEICCGSYYDAMQAASGGAGRIELNCALHLGGLTPSLASLELKEEEVGQGLQATVIATDGIAVIVNNDNPTEELSSDQVKSIYTGETYTWDEVTE